MTDVATSTYLSRARTDRHGPKLRRRTRSRKRPAEATLPSLMTLLNDPTFGHLTIFEFGELMNRLDPHGLAL